MHAYLNNQRNRELEKLTPAMWRMLFDIRDHDDPGYSLRGMSAHGGASGTSAALRKRGLMIGDKLTALGSAVTYVEWRGAF
jgi:hypothetical protein